MQQKKAVDGDEYWGDKMAVKNLGHRDVHLKTNPTCTTRGNG